MRKAWEAHVTADPDSDVNLTPLIDVSLVLVVILLLATPLAFESAIGVNREDQSGARAEITETPERIELRVLGDGRVRLNREELALEELDASLRPLLQANPLAPVVVDCAPGIVHADFVAALDQSRRSGATRLAVAGG